MDGSALNLDGILSTVLSNPEMMKSALELAKGLSQNGGTQALFGSGSRTTDAREDREDNEKQNDKTHAVGNDREVLSLLPQGEAVRKKQQTGRHRKLLEALSLYMDEGKRDKLELVIRLLDLMEFAGNMGQQGGE